MIKHFEQNTEGTDYVVGDIHGCFSKLRVALEELNFDKSKDRLFLTGDLVDRGPESEDCLEWLAQPWFHSVLGNHEQMAIDCVQGYFERYNYISNGGAWFLALTKEEQQLYADAFSVLPVMIEVDTPTGVVGIVHADTVLKSWKELKLALVGHNSEGFTQQCIWSRDRYNYKDTSDVIDIHQVIVGHTPIKTDIWLGNVHYIDTGACFGGKLTIVKVN
jgi:serine/threonine protein phosphatase 1